MGIDTIYGPYTLLLCCGMYVQKATSIIPFALIWLARTRINNVHGAKHGFLPTNGTNDREQPRNRSVRSHKVE